MKKIMTFSLMGLALGLAACGNTKEADYTYEQQAPFADSRTQGAAEAPVVADRVYTRAQRK